MSKSLEDLCEQIRANDTFVVACHISPDPDAVGSAAALQMLLTANGCRAYFYLPDSEPEYLSEYLVESNRVSSIEELPKDAIVVIVDTATKNRACVEDGFFENYSKSKILVIDHHASNSGWGDVNYIDDSAAASAVIVCDIANELNIEISPAIANLLFAALADDTGSFRYSNSNQRSFEVAASLVAAGASPERIANSLYFSIPPHVMKLRLAALKTLEVHADGLVASIMVSKQMLADSGATIEESDGIVDIARSLRGVACALFFRERDEGFRISLRAKDSNIDVNKVAAVFGGGGHPAAAGCTISSGSYEEVLAKVLDEVQKQLSN